MLLPILSLLCATVPRKGLKQTSRDVYEVVSTCEALSAKRRTELFPGPIPLSPHGFLSGGQWEGTVLSLPRGGNRHHPFPSSPPDIPGLTVYFRIGRGYGLSIQAAREGSSLGGFVAGD